MLIHVTKSLIPFLNGQVQSALTSSDAIKKRSNDANAIWQWHAHRFPYGDSCCLMVCHDQTGFVLVLPGVEENEYDYLSDIVKDYLVGYIEDLGFSPAQSKQMALSSGPVLFDDQSENSVKEMLSVAWQDLHNLLVERPNLLLWNPLRLNELINQRIIKKDDNWCRPDELFRALVDQEVAKLP